MGTPYDTGEDPDGPDQEGARELTPEDFGAVEITPESFGAVEIPSEPDPSQQHGTPDLPASYTGDLPFDARVIDRGLSAAQPPSAMEAFGRGLRNPFNFSDEIAKGVTAAGDLVTGRQALPRAAGRGFGAPLDQRSDPQIAADEERHAQKAAEAAHPYAQMAGRGLTETALAALGASAAGVAAPAANLTGRVVQAAKIGGAVGAVQGYGTSEDPAALGQLRDTAVGGIQGALTAPAVGELTHQALMLPRRATAAVRTGYGSLVNSRAADAIEQEHGPELAAFARQVADPSAAGAQQRAQAAAGADPEALAAHARALESNVTQIAKAGDTIQAAETIAKKAKLAGLMMRADETDPAPAVEATDALMQDFSNQVNEWKANTVPGHQDNNFLNRVGRAIQQYERQTGPDSSSQAGDPYAVASQRFALADQVKREMQQTVKGVNRNSPAIESMHAAEEALRQHLESPQLWGPTTGAMQSARNAAWHEYLNLGTKDVSPEKTFLTDYQGLPSAKDHAYRSLSVGSTRDLQDVAQKAGTLEGAPEEWKLRQWTDKAATLGHALSDHPILPDEAQTALAAGQRESAAHVGSILDQRIAEKAAADRISRISATKPVLGQFATQVQRVPTGMLEAGGLASIAYAHPETGAGAIALGGAAQLAKNYIRDGTPQALAERASELGRLEAQPGNPSAVAALQRMRGEVQPLGRTGDLAARATGAQFTGTQLSDALRQWREGSGQGDTKGHDLESSVKRALATDPQSLGQYRGLLQGSQDISQELHKLQGDPKWVRDVLPRLQNSHQ